MRARVRFFHLRLSVPPSVPFAAFVRVPREWLREILNEKKEASHKAEEAPTRPPGGGGGGGDDGVGGGGGTGRGDFYHRGFAVRPPGRPGARVGGRGATQQRRRHCDRGGVIVLTSFLPSSRYMHSSRDAACTRGSGADMPRLKGAWITESSQTDPIP